jgi:hypothetical protein
MARVGSFEKSIARDVVKMLEQARIEDRPKVKARLVKSARKKWHDMLGSFKNGMHVDYYLYRTQPDGTKKLCDSVYPLERRWWRPEYSPMKNASRLRQKKRPRVW